MRKIFTYVDETVKYILFILLAVMLLVAFLQIFFRSVLTISVSWTDELTRYLFIWSIFIGVGYSIRRSGHISIDTIYLFIKGKQKETYKKGIYVIQLIFFILVFAVSMNFLIGNFNNLSPAMRIPMGYVYISLPIGCILSSLFLLEKLFFKENEVME